MTSKTAVGLYLQRKLADGSIYYTASGPVLNCDLAADLPLDDVGLKLAFELGLLLADAERIVRTPNDPELVAAISELLFTEELRVSLAPGSVLIEYDETEEDPSSGLRG